MLENKVEKLFNELIEVCEESLHDEAVRMNILKGLAKELSGAYEKKMVSHLVTLLNERLDNGVRLNVSNGTLRIRSDRPGNSFDFVMYPPHENEFAADAFRHLCTYNSNVDTGVELVENIDLVNQLLKLFFKFEKEETNEEKIITPPQEPVVSTPEKAAHEEKPIENEVLPIAENDVVVDESAEASSDLEVLAEPEPVKTETKLVALTEKEETPKYVNTKTPDELRAELEQAKNSVEMGKLTTFTKYLSLDVASSEGLFKQALSYFKNIVDTIKSRGDEVEYITDVTTKAYKDANNLTPPMIKALVDLASIIDQNNRSYQWQSKGIYGEETTNHDVFIHPDIRPLMIYFVLTNDLVCHSVVGVNKLSRSDVLDLVYHITKYDEIKNLISATKTTNDFVAAVIAVLSIFVRHNFNYAFYIDTKLIENPPILPDVWTNKIDFIKDSYTDFLANEGNRLVTSPEDSARLKDYLEKLNEQLIQEPNFVRNNENTDAIVSIVSKHLGKSAAINLDSNRNAYISVTKSGKHILIVLPTAALALHLREGSVVAKTIFHQYQLDLVMRWIYYTLTQ